MTWVQVRDLGEISRCEIIFRCRRDCVEIAHLHPGHLEALPSGGGRRPRTRGIHNGRVCSDSTKWSSTVVLGAWVHLGAFWLVCSYSPQTPMRQPPLYSATLSNRNEPGHSRYLRGMICALRQMVTPLDGLGAGARSRRNLACI